MEHIEGLSVVDSAIGTNWWSCAARTRSLQLVENMWHFQSKECSDPRDKAYSLLYLSRDTANLKVDYHTSTAQFALDLLRERADPFCLCLMKLLLQSLRVDKDRLPPPGLSRYGKSYLEFKAYDIGDADDCGHYEESLNLESI
jgi:hypothetical protein